MKQSDIDRLTLIRMDGVGPVKYNQLINEFGSARSALDNLAIKDSLHDSVSREIELMNRKGSEFIFDDDPRYPVNLKSMHGHPPVISVLGNPDTLSKESVAMVGTRNASANGLKFMGQLSYEFAENGFLVVSGMAMGSDAAAHQGALKSSKNNVTVAVLAGGVDQPWPIENESLYKSIIERGCVISDMPIGTKPIAKYFVKRNQLVAGISNQMILGEATDKSGSMITANHMIKLSRPVFAIPSHPTDPRSFGPNSLIKSGQATLCMGITDFFKKDTKINEKKIQVESNILELLSQKPLSESEISLILNKNVSDIKKELVILEINGSIIRVEGGFILA